MFKNLRNKKKKGFTLIELIIVIAIIAVLAAIAIPKFGEVRKSAALKADIANAKTIANAATAVMAEGELGAGPFVINQTSDNAIEKYLQNPPAPETKDMKQYNVTITNGFVSITMSKTDGSGSVNLFPVPEKSDN